MSDIKFGCILLKAIGERKAVSERSKTEVR
jgi:hypothetical protein